MGQKYTHIPSRVLLAEWVSFFPALLLNLLRSPVLVVNLTKIDMGIEIIRRKVLRVMLTVS
jgi:hypothetical protein